MRKYVYFCAVDLIKRINDQRLPDSEDVPWPFLRMSHSIAELQRAVSLSGIVRPFGLVWTERATTEVILSTGITSPGRISLTRQVLLPLLASQHQVYNHGNSLRRDQETSPTASVCVCDLSASQLDIGRELIANRGIYRVTTAADHEGGSQSYEKPLFVNI